MPKIELLIKNNLWA